LFFEVRHYDNLHSFTFQVTLGCKVTRLFELDPGLGRFTLLLISASGVMSLRIRAIVVPILRKSYTTGLACWIIKHHVAPRLAMTFHPEAAAFAK
jgi:hypothetical protein